MNKIFVSLVASGAVATCMSATALASNASIDTTGPGSTNVITSSSRNNFNNNVNNKADTGNWNYQNAKSGDVRINCNTKVNGSGNGTGNAWNSNSGNNNVSYNNSGGGNWNGNWEGGNGNGGNGTIYLTGPGSYNRISGGGNNNNFRSNINNNVNAQNFSNQNARSGGVTISGNTVVEGVGGSGSATNENSGSNAVEIDNSIPTPQMGSNNGGSAYISTTGPYSYNAISGGNGRNQFSSNVNNNVNATNSNYQTATTGNVVITGNTVVKGVGGSGDAANYNQGMNNVGVTNQ